MMAGECTVVRVLPMSGGKVCRALSLSCSKNTYYKAVKWATDVSECQSDVMAPKRHIYLDVCLIKIHTKC